jgi:threonine/homoserine/homoserine lactone efflux protein
MPNTELLMAFFAATAVFAYMPGPAMLYTAAQTVARGRRAGWLAALGIHMGGYVHVLGAALGISALFAAVPALYLLVKFAGACYLIWLGVELIRSKEDYSSVTSSTRNDSGASDSGASNTGAINSGNAAESKQAFSQSIAVEVLNPKTAIFYIAFLPQFTDPAVAMPLWVQLIVLGTIVNLLFSSADILCVLLSSSVVHYLSNTGSGTRAMRYIGGGILIGLGVNLALTGQ